MKTQVKLNSMMMDGVGSGPESEAINLIYGILLGEYGQNHYSFIAINQIDDTLEEVVMKEPSRKIFISIRYPVYKDFKRKTVDQKNIIRLDVIHTALKKVSEQDQKLDIATLELIRNKILEHNFLFNFSLKDYVNKRDRTISAKLLVSPEMDKFNYFISLQQDGSEKCRILIYSGGTSIFYVDHFFRNGRWKNNNELIITGNKKQVEIHVFFASCHVEFVNLTSYANPPLFEMFKAEIAPEKINIHYKDWVHSLPPAQAAIIRKSEN